MNIIDEWSMHKSNLGMFDMQHYSSIHVNYSQYKSDNGLVFAMNVKYKAIKRYTILVPNIKIKNNILNGWVNLLVWTYHFILTISTEKWNN